MILITLTVGEKDALGRIGSMNKQIQQGTRKGFILGRELLEYEKNSIENPLPSEHAIDYSMVGPFDKEKIVGIVQGMLQ